MYIKSTDSTNTQLRQMAGDAEALGRLRADHPVLHLWTGYQSAGRGQAGNGWQSEPDQNILLSILVEQPPVPVEQQWRLSMAFALAVHEAVETVLSRQGIDTAPLTIKWPNDIYYADRKLAGILIENQLCSRGIAHSILGIGLNVNQTTWPDSVPNPVSLRLISHHEADCQSVVDMLLESWHRQIHTVLRPSLKDEYMSRLYRRQGMHPFVEREVSTAPTMLADRGEKGVFVASIEDVDEQGQLLLRDDQQRLRTYHFKQVRFVL